jgi:acyl phosphate:glycerol-3-phosphate acyltransferase
MEYVLAAVVGYLAGSIPVALIVAGRHGVDLRATGDGNPGAWNALEQLGPGRAWPVFAGDGMKGTAAGCAGLALAGAGGAYAGVAAAMMGHAAPVFARFRGGKAVMTFVGGAFALSPIAAGIALAAGAGLGLGARSFAWGARAGVFAFPVVQLAFDPPGRVAATGALMAFIGLRFLLGGRRSARATSGTDGARST